MRKKNAFFVVCLFLILTLAWFSGCKGESVEKAVPEAVTEEVKQLESTGEIIEWSMFTAYGQEDGACCEVWPIVFRDVEQATGGRLKINIYWSGQHPYEGSDMLKVIRDGEAELAHFYSGYLTSVEPVFGIDSIPMLLPENAMHAFGALARLWGDFEQNTDGVLENILQNRWKASMIHLMPASPQRFFTDGYEITGIGSLRRHKVRVYSPELAKLVTILGGTPVSLSFGEVYTGLSTGLIDGLVTSLQFAESGGFMEICDTINMWEIMAAMDGVMVSIDALNQLPPDVRDVFLQVVRNSAQKPEMKEIINNAIILEEQLLEGKKALVPDPNERDKVIKQVEAEIIKPWIDSTGEEAKIAIEQIEAYKSTLK